MEPKSWSNPQAAKRALVVFCEGLGNRFAELVRISHHQVLQVPHHRDFTLKTRRLPQNLRHQQPALPVELDHLPVVAGALQELLLGLVHFGERR
jgi:hypothetical protein